MSGGAHDLGLAGAGSIEQGETHTLIEQTLEVARSHLGMDIAWVAELHEDLEISRVLQGDGAGWGIDEDSSIAAADSVCRRLLDGRLPGAIRDAPADPVAGSLETTRRLGIRGHIAVPLVLSGGRVYGALCAMSRSPKAGLDDRDLSFVRVLARLVADQLELREVERRRAGLGTRAEAAKALAAAAEYRDAYTSTHSSAVVELAGRVGRRLVLGEEEVARIELVALLHDIGKLAVPDEILRKRGPLDGREWQILRRHPVDGAKIVASVPALASLAGDVRAEHERWDGAGYPDGLAGAAIPIASRITFVCDAFDAMTSDRPYRRALPLSEALSELERGRGSQFWPVAVDALLTELVPASPSPA